VSGCERTYDQAVTCLILSNAFLVVVGTYLQREAKDAVQ
jgi:hypothetical protein